jgi:hypothetical protein
MQAEGNSIFIPWGPAWCGRQRMVEPGSLRADTFCSHPLVEKGKLMGTPYGWDDHYLLAVLLFAKVIGC